MPKGEWFSFDIGAEVYINPYPETQRRHKLLCLDPFGLDTKIVENEIEYKKGRRRWCCGTRVDSLSNGHLYSNTHVRIGVDWC
jgi:hypothetical protein